MEYKKLIQFNYRSEMDPVSWKAVIVVLFLSSIVVTFYLRSIFTTPKCFIADNIKLISSNTIRSTDYFLYQIISGATDKIEFLALFDQAVEFDECGEPNIPATYSQFVEYGLEEKLQEQWIKQVVVSNGRFNIEYSTIQIDKWLVQWLDN